MAHEADDLQLSDAVQRLTEVGFDVVGESHSPWFGDVSIAMHRGIWRVALSRDKGQLFLTVSAGVDGGHDVSLWESCLDQVLPSLDPREFEAEVDAMVRRLPELDRLDVDDIARLTECLRANGRWRFMTRRQLGLVKPPSP